MAKELNNNDALRVLSEVDVKSANNLTELAIEKLLEHDLTTKYWHKGNVYLSLSLLSLFLYFCLS